MQPWQIKALELEATVLKHLHEFIHEHALCFLVGIIYLLLAVLVWVLSGALRRKGSDSTSQVRPVIFVDLWEKLPPAEPEDLNLFPPQSSAQCDCEHDDWD